MTYTGKIIQHRAGYYYVIHEGVLIQARARGNIRHADFRPLVGDIARFTINPDGSGNIESILERRNVIIRPRIANVDKVLIVTSCLEPKLSPILLDRFISYFEMNDVQTVLIFTKIDLLSPEDEQWKWIQEYRDDGFKVHTISNVTREGIEDLKEVFKDSVSVLAGQSGVGKTTIINSIDSEQSRETQAISRALGRGKHTTRETELMPCLGGMLADTPGFSSIRLKELGITKQDLSFAMHSFAKRKPNCKFSTCLHNSEPKCAIKAAVKNGEISEHRYKNYLRMLEEVE